MKTTLSCHQLSAILHSLLCIIPLVSSQIVGCNGPNITCAASRRKNDNEGSCSYERTNPGIGFISIESNITSHRPLTWTLIEGDRTPKDNEFSYRDFYLGSPPSLDLQNITDFGGCALVLGGNLTSDLQLPRSSNGLDNFGCGTVMGDLCAQDIAAMVRGELLGLLSDTSYEGDLSPCNEVGRRLQNTTYPESCTQVFGKRQFSYEHASSKFQTRYIPS